jgi:hypothetical protein
MAERTARDRRAAARADRRAKAAPAGAPEPGEEDGHDDSAAVDALRTAATAAIAGAAIGAARAFTQRSHDEPDVEDEKRPEEDEEVAPADEPAPEPEAESSHEHDSDPKREPEPEPQPEPLAAGEIHGLVARAREQLRDLRGVEAESVSSVRPTPNGWRIGLEVVELRRIPESTDVLATYEVELDGNGDLITFERTGRYHRSEAERR